MYSKFWSLRNKSQNYRDFHCCKYFVARKLAHSCFYNINLSDVICARLLYRDLGVVSSCIEKTAFYSSWSRVACIASVSARVRRESWDESQKKKLDWKRLLRRLGQGLSVCRVVQTGLKITQDSAKFEFGTSSVYKSNSS